jgi:hypothetical protein
MNQKIFLSRLSILAKLSETTLCRELVELYDRTLSTTGYDNATRAVEHFIVNRRSRDAFPSIAELRKVATGEGEDIDVANAVAGRIFEAIKEMDKCRLLTQGVKDFLGDIAWSVVNQSGGWDFVYNSINDHNAGQHRAQFRDLALSLIRRNKLGHDLTAAPSFGKAPTGSSIQKFIQSSTEQIGGTTNGKE